MRNTSATETSSSKFWYDIPIAKWYTGGAPVPCYDSDGTTADIWDNSADSAIETTDWDNPPTTLAGLVQYQNGILAGISGKDVCISVPFVHYAWPEDYRVKVDYDLVGLGVYGMSLIALTSGYYYVITGSDSETLQCSEPIEAQKCLSQRGIVSTKYGVIYPCPDGLFIINSNGGAVLTKNTLTKKQWEALVPSGKAFSDIISFYHDDQYYMFFSGTDVGYIVNLEDPWIIDLDIGNNVYHGVIDVSDDDLILLTNTGGADYYASEWDRHATNKLTYTNKSRAYQTPQRERMVGAKVRGEQSASDAITLSLYGDGSVIYDSPARYVAGMDDDRVLHYKRSEEHTSELQSR
jgi:hypothetical protein